MAQRHKLKIRFNFAQFFQKLRKIIVQEQNEMSVKYSKAVFFIFCESSNYY